MGLGSGVFVLAERTISRVSGICSLFVRCLQLFGQQLILRTVFPRLWYVSEQLSDA